MLGLRRLTTVVILAMCAALVPQVAQAAPGDIGWEGTSFAGAGADPTGSKPESKLWWNDGWWWASLFAPASGDFHIFRLNTATQTWMDTGVALDDRPNTRADALWDGTHLYVASHVFSTPQVIGDASRLYRYSYAAATDTYSLDPGFPTVINTFQSETLVIDKDSTGTLWATWTQAKQVYVVRTVGDDQTWGTPFVPSVSGTTVASDDISSVVAFGGGKIGLMWSNQSVSAMYFAVHVDGQPENTWEASRTALQGPNNADDHINLKSLQSDGSGRVFAAVKTSLTTSSSPQIMLLVRDSATGNWASHVFGRVSDKHTRPIVLLDEEAGILHMFATAPSAAFPNGKAAIYEKTAPINNISFAAGRGTPVIMDADVPEMNDATSTKQNVTATTGLVVLAGNITTARYWHHYATLAPPPPTAPTANFTAAPTSGPLPLPVTFTDTSTGGPTSWSWDFGDGATSTERNPLHTYTTGGSYTVSLTVSNAVGTDTETKSGLIAAGAQTFTPVADAYVRSNAVNKNYGTATNLRVRSSGPTMRSYLKFDVTGVSGTVVSARLRLRVKDTGTDGGRVYPVANTSWTETGITWSNAPAPGAVPLASIGAVPTAGTWADVDVTGGVTGNGLLTLAVADGSTNVVDYDSRESANDPQLIVTAAGAPVAAAGFTASPTSGTAPLPVTFTDTSTGSPTAWSWDFGDSTTSTEQNPSHTFETPGVPTVTLTVTYASSDTSTATRVITVTEAGSGGTSTINPVADAYVKSDSTGQNFGSAAFVRVRTGTPVIRSYLKFDVSGLGAVQSAHLRLHVADDSTDGGNVYLVADSSWQEGTITYANAPPTSGSAVAGIGPAAATIGAWVDVDVTSAVSGNGILTLAISDGSINGVNYDSRETGANAPQLVIVS